jgi:hypothetical protein
MTCSVFTDAFDIIVPIHKALQCIYIIMYLSKNCYYGTYMYV